LPAKVLFPPSSPPLGKQRARDLAVGVTDAFFSPISIPFPPKILEDKDLVFCLESLPSQPLPRISFLVMGKRIPPRPPPWPGGTGRRQSPLSCVTPFQSAAQMREEGKQDSGEAISSFPKGPRKPREIPRVTL